MDTLSKIQELVESCGLPLSAEDSERLSKELYEVALAWMREPPSSARRMLRRAKTHILHSFRPKVRNVGGALGAQPTADPTNEFAINEVIPPKIMSYTYTVKSLDNYDLLVGSAIIPYFQTFFNAVKSPARHVPLKELRGFQGRIRRRSAKDALRTEIGAQAITEIRLRLGEVERISISKSSLFRHLETPQQGSPYSVGRDLYKTAEPQACHQEPKPWHKDPSRRGSSRTLRKGIGAFAGNPRTRASSGQGSLHAV